MEAPQQDRKETARNLFLHTEKTRQEIADILDVNSKTLYLWIKNGKWDEMKTAARQSPMILVQDMYNHIQAINENIYAREGKCPTPKEVDMLRKLALTAKQLEVKSLGTYTEVLQELTTFINRQDHDLAVQVIKIADKYVRGKVERRKVKLDDEVIQVMANLKTQQHEEQREEQQEAAKQHDKHKTQQTNTQPHSVITNLQPANRSLSECSDMDTSATFGAPVPPGFHARPLAGAGGLG